MISRYAEQAVQKILPQERQWCLRRNVENGVLQPKQRFARLSGIHVAGVRGRIVTFDFVDRRSTIMDMDNDIYLFGHQVKYSKKNTYITNILFL